MVELMEEIMKILPHFQPRQLSGNESN